jgi:glutamate racemase
MQVVGVEPGLKPAAVLTKSGVVGVLATTSTLASEKFQKLQQQITDSVEVRFITQACSGLVDQIEKGELNSRATADLVERYVAPLLKQNVDTLVLGCTHYPFVQPLIDQVAKTAGRNVIQVDTGEPVAKQLQRLLIQHSLLHENSATPAHILAFTSGSRTALETAFRQLLGLSVNVASVDNAGFAR